MKVDLEFKRKILDLMIGGENISYCYQCGYCNERCPVHARVGSGYNPRDLVLLSALGAKEALLAADPFAVWGCTACETCDEVCPKQIPITEIISLLKQVTLKLGKAPAYYGTVGASILASGMVIPSQKAIEQRREKLGVGPSPAVPVDEVKKILEVTKFADTVNKLKGGK
jgi:heterodisulfide reductase subunit C